MKNTVDASGIVQHPSPALRAKCAKVTKKDRPGDVAQEMIDKMLEWESGRPHETAVALACPQIGINKNIIVFRDRGRRGDAKFEILYNVRITKRSTRMRMWQEGCLSVKDVYAYVPRHETIKIVAEDENFQRVERKLSGSEADAMQHEVDHLNGGLFIDLKPEGEDFYRLDENGDMVKTDLEI